MGHSELVPSQDLCKPHSECFYMPMHGVLKLSSSTTKLRAVCDASAKTSTGHSLNYTLLPGPSLYPLLTTIITQFRDHSIGMTADVSRMFREVGLNPEEADYHRYLHQDEDGVMRDYRMNRLTFGVTSSPYLATQVLRQLASDYQTQYPEAAAIVRQTFYVDDCLTGTNSLDEAKRLREQLNQLLAKGCMTLRKWRSSSAALLESVPEELRESSDLTIVAATPGDCSKALGLHWSTTDDTLHVATPVLTKQPATKRLVASAVARIFDVMGWYTPATLPAKLLLQQAWIRQLGWDDLLPPELQEKWRAWAEDISSITKFPIPRSIKDPSKTIQSRQLHGFSDASILAYGGAVYLRTFFTDTTVSIHLIASKARVAPLKTLTVPRLELCGALLLSQLIQVVAQDLNLPSESIFAWSDSSTVLGWLQKPTSKLPVFIANRVQKIMSRINPTQ